MTDFKTVRMRADFIYETEGPGRGPRFPGGMAFIFRADRADWLVKNARADHDEDAKDALHECDLLPESYIDYKPPAKRKKPPKEWPPAPSEPDGELELKPAGAPEGDADPEDVNGGKNQTDGDGGGKPSDANDAGAHQDADSDR